MTQEAQIDYSVMQLSHGKVMTRHAIKTLTDNVTRKVTLDRKGGRRKRQKEDTLREEKKEKEKLERERRAAKRNMIKEHGIEKRRKHRKRRGRYGEEDEEDESDLLEEEDEEGQESERSTETKQRRFGEGDRKTEEIKEGRRKDQNTTEFCGGSENEGLEGESITMLSLIHI